MPKPNHQPNMNRDALAKEHQFQPMKAPEKAAAAVASASRRDGGGARIERPQPKQNAAGVLEDDQSFDPRDRGKEEKEKRRDRQRKEKLGEKGKKNRRGEKKRRKEETGKDRGGKQERRKREEQKGREEKPTEAVGIRREPFRHNIPLLISLIARSPTRAISPTPQRAISPSPIEQRAKSPLKGDRLDQRAKSPQKTAGRMTSS